MGAGDQKANFCPKGVTIERLFTNECNIDLTEDNISKRKRMTLKKLETEYIRLLAAHYLISQHSTYMLVLEK